MCNVHWISLIILNVYAFLSFILLTRTILLQVNIALLLDTNCLNRKLLLKEIKCITKHYITTAKFAANNALVYSFVRTIKIYFFCSA